MPDRTVGCPPSRSHPIPLVNHRLVLASLLSLLGALPAQIAFQNGDKVAFLGDSITEDGQQSPGGYVQLVRHGLAASGVKIEIVGAGISGHKSNDMLARLEADVLSKKPQWMTLSCGVNDVWHGANGVPLPDYQKNITAIVDRALAAGVKVVILTSTMIGEDATNPENVRLAGYNDFLRALAKEKGCRAIEGTPVTVIPAPRPRPSTGPAASSPGARLGDARVDPAEQRARDSDARRILGEELRREEDRLATMKREFNNGEPERRGDERNFAKYQERVAEMRAAITRKEADVAALKRELAKLGS